MKIYRGASAAARAYVEADRSRADDYYLAEGTGLATHYTATPEALRQAGSLDGPRYERWVAGYRVETGEPKGRLRSDEHGVRFVEVVVNGPKTWSLAAALYPEIAAAYDAAQDRAAEQVIGWLAQHATTRVGPRGRQVQVSVEQVEAAVVRHYTSRAGDPHRHLHLQINARVFAEGRWRGLHTVGVRDSLEAINGIGHAAVFTDAGFRAALAGHGLDVHPVSGEIAQLAPYVGGFSARAAQIGRNVEAYEAQWRAANPGTEPGPRLRQAWDRRAWAEARPDKVVPKDGADLVARWNETLHELGYRDPAQVALPILISPAVASLDRDHIARTVLSWLGAKRSAWNAADIRGEVEKQIAATGLVIDAGVRLELAEDITARAFADCVRLVAGNDVPEHVRSLTSTDVLAVEVEIVTRLTARADQPSTVRALAERVGEDLDVAQRRAVGALAGGAALVVVEGAAGAGKTTTLAATRSILAEQGHRLIVVTPTLKAAQVAATEVDSDAFSAAWLAVQHGWRWDNDGTWTHEPDATPDPRAVLRPGDLMLCDEAGMLDQDTARALLTIADEAGARIALVGDRHQLPAVGRGGVLDVAATWAGDDTVIGLDTVHRFTDAAYADLSVALRRGEHPNEVFDALLARGEIHVHASEAERTHVLAEHAAAAILGGNDPNGALVLADTREQATALNGAIRDRLVAAGHVDDGVVVTTDGAERLGVGDRVATRLNDRDLGVANRQTWTVAAVGPDGTLELAARGRTIRRIPATYARQHVELAYAVTVYGAQGETAVTADFLIGESTGAAAAYVAMTRGRESNTAHLIADSLDEAREAWELVFGRDRADLGPTHARSLALDDIDRYGAQARRRPLSEPAEAAGRPLEDVLADLGAAWAEQSDLGERHEQLADARVCLEQAVAIRARYAPRLQALRQEEKEAGRCWQAARERVERLDNAIAHDRRQLHETLTARWQANLPLLLEAAAVVRDGAGAFGQHRRHVRDARATLTAWAEDWRVVIGELPTDPDQLATAFNAGQMGLTDPALREAIDAHADRQVARVHPSSDQIRAEEGAADWRYLQAENDRRAHDEHLFRLLRPLGRYGLVEHSDSLLTQVREDLARVDDDQRRLSDRICELVTEPAVRALPAGDFDALHDTWRADRMHQRLDRDRERARAAHEAERARLARSTDLDQHPTSPSQGRSVGGLGR